MRPCHARDGPPGRSPWRRGPLGEKKAARQSEGVYFVAVDDLDRERDLLLLGGGAQEREDHRVDQRAARLPRVDVRKPPTVIGQTTVTSMQSGLFFGYVSLVGFILFIPTSIWAAPLGARLAHRLSKRTLELAFGTFLLVMASRFAVSLMLG